MSEFVQQTRFPERIRRQAEDAPVEPKPVGKRTLFEPGPHLAKPDMHAFQTGDDYVDKGMACDTAATRDCFLRPDQRARLVTRYQQGVERAWKAYSKALGRLRVDELIKKDPEATNWVFDLLLDVVGLLLTRTANNVANLVREKMIAGIDTATLAGSPKVVENAISTAVSLGKKQLKPPMVESMKQINVSFLDLLDRRADTAFGWLQQGALALMTTDDILLAFARAFDATPDVDNCERELREKLGRFDKSNVSKIGVHRTERFRFEGVVRADELTSFFQTETKAYWQDVLGRQRLGLWQRGHTEPMRMPNSVPGTYVHDPNFGREFFREWVADEFVGVAVQMHTEKWGAAPTVRPAGYFPWMGS